MEIRKKAKRKPVTDIKTLTRLENLIIKKQKIIKLRLIRFFTHKGIMKIYLCVKFQTKLRIMEINMK